VIRLDRLGISNAAASSATAGVKTATMASLAPTSTMSFPTIVAPKVRTVPFVVSNVSHVDNYETAEFVAPVAGQYNVEVTAPRWDVCPYDNSYATNLALAWSKQ
jgi:hypothetical protein